MQYEYDSNGRQTSILIIILATFPKGWAPPFKIFGKEKNKKPRCSGVNVFCKRLVLSAVYYNAPASFKTASIPFLLIVRIAEVANLISTHSFKEGTKNFFVCKFG